MSNLCWNSVNVSEDQDIEELLQNWNPPRIPINDIYKRRGIFESKSKYEIKTNEKTLPIQGEYVDLQLLERAAILQHKRKFSNLHLGLVQVAIKPLTRNGTNYSVLVSLRDCRLLRFNESVLAMAESSLHNGPIFFNCYPGYQVSLQDPHTLEVLTLNIKVPEFRRENGSQDIAVVYRHCYKVLKDNSDPKEKVSPTINTTTFIDTNLVNDNVAVPITVAWDSVEVPERWRKV